MKSCPLSARSMLPLCLLLAACVSSDGEPVAPDHTEAIDRIVNGLRSEVAVAGRPALPTFSLDERMAEHDVPGVSVAVAVGGRLAWARGYGVKEVGRADSVSTTTLFQAASVSKPIAATGLLRMVADGILDLDTPVNEYLESWKLPDNEHTAQVPVTLRHLVSHGAGTTVWGFPGYEPGAELPTVPQILDGSAPANTPPVRVDLTPGRYWRYSGGGVTIAQLAVSDVGGKPFADVMDELVLEPFGMNHSTFAQPLGPDQIPEAASGHRDGEPLPERWIVYPELAAAGLWTTPSDLLAWAIQISAAYHGASDAVLPESVAREMLTPQHGSTGLGPSLGGVGSGYFFGHGGANAGFRAQLVYFPETGDGAVVMSNGDGGGRLNREVLLAIAAEYGWPDYADVEPISLDPSRVPAYLGTFAAEQLPVSVTLSQAGDSLVVDGVGALGHQEIVFLSTDRAVSLGTGTEMVFRRGPDGRITAVESMGLVMARQR